MRKITIRLSEEAAEQSARYCKYSFFTLQNLVQAFLELYTPSKYLEISDRALALRQDRVASYSREKTSVGAAPSAHTGGRNKPKPRRFAPGGGDKK